MVSRTTLVIFAAASLMLAIGCSEDKPSSPGSNLPDTSATNTTAWDGDGFWLSEINATSSDHFIYYSFATRDTLDITDEEAESNSDWDIALERSVVILNGGVSGPGSVEGADLAMIGHADSTDFMAFDDTSAIEQSDWVSDSYDLLVDDWYSYNPVSHMLALTHYVYMMMDAEGGFVKFQVISMENNGMPPDMGTISMQYIYNAGSPTFTGTPDTITFDGSDGGPACVDFSAGMITDPTDIANSLDWDILFESYEIHQNNTVFGSGAAASYACWADQTDPTDFDEIETGPPVVNAYFPDLLGSVLSDWYNYDGQTHTLTSKEHVYVIHDGANYYKLQIMSYYRDIGGSPAAAYYTYRWLELE